MRTHVEYNPRTGDYLIWAWQASNLGIHRYEYRPSPGGMTWCRAEEADSYGTDKGEPSMVLTVEMVDALVEAVKGITPGDALQGAVIDARNTRDRLLMLVERLVTPVYTTAVQEEA